MEFLTARQSLLEKYFDNYYDGHKAIIRNQDSEKSVYIKENTYDAVELSYMETREALDTKIKALGPDVQLIAPTTANTDHVSTQFHLPKFSIPDFSGDILEWESFRDQFQGILHRSLNLSNVNKFLLLQQHLKGNAAEMLKNTQVTEASFQDAWDDLSKRYGNKRLLRTHHMNSLLDLQECSATNAHEIQRILDFFKKL